MTKYCPICNKQFVTYPSYERKGRGKYCSVPCSLSVTGKKRNRDYSLASGKLNPNYHHGFRVNRKRSRVYSSWANMVSRCCNRDSKDWKYYGGRGIQICDSIRNNPSTIQKLIGDPAPKLSINRIDNNGNYSCGQCDDCVNHGWSANIEWATRETQSRNRRNTKYSC